MVEISPVTGSASPAPGLASAPNLLPLSLAPAVRCSAPPPGPSRTLLLPRLLALHVTICGTILLCHCPHHPLVLLPPASLRFPASLPAPPSISSRLSSLLLWPCALPGISPYSPSFRLSAHTLSPLPLLSLSTSDPPPSFPYFPLASYVPCYLTFLSSWEVSPATPNWVPSEDPSSSCVRHPPRVLEMGGDVPGVGGKSGPRTRWERRRGLTWPPRT